MKSRLSYRFQGKLRQTPPLVYHQEITPTPEKQLNQLYQLLVDVNRKLRQMKVTYWLHAGTLLGAVRHRGFIPWDDDIDLCYRWQDHQLLIKALKSLEAENPKYQLLQIFPGASLIIKGTTLHADFMMMGQKTPQVYSYAYPLEKTQPTFHLSQADGWQEAWEEHQIFPLKTATFEDLKLPVPRMSKQMMVKMYSKKCLTEVKVAQESFHYMNKLPWLLKGIDFVGRQMLKTPLSRKLLFKLSNSSTRKQLAV